MVDRNHGSGNAVSVPGCTEHCNGSAEKSKRKIKYELLSKGVDEQIIEEKLATFEDEEEEAVCRRLAEKYLRNKEFDLKTKQKYFNSMLGKGFDYSLILKMWEEITNDRD